MNANRPTRLTTTLPSVACSLLLAAAVLALPSSARAGDDRSVEEKFIGGLLESLGLERDHASIDYHERAPLVIPSNHDLPQPENAGVAASNNPAWPNDPDVARERQERRMERERRKTSVTEQIERDQHALRPEEITPGGNPRTPPSGRKIVQSLGEGGTRLSPSQLGYKGGLFGIFAPKDDDTTARFTGEPPRTALTEPPQGYQTPSPDQPYGPGKASSTAKATNYLETHGTEEARH